MRGAARGAERRSHSLSSFGWPYHWAPLSLLSNLTRDAVLASPDKSKKANNKKKKKSDKMQSGRTSAGSTPTTATPLCSKLPSK